MSTPGATIRSSARRGGYPGWRPAGDIRVDLHEARKLLCHSSGAADNPAETAQQTIRRLQAAVELYRGTFLEGFNLRDGEGYSGWLQLERDRWQQRWLDALAWLVDASMSVGNWAPAIEHARRGIVTNPLQERFHRVLMRLHYTMGDRTAALSQYRLCREVLGHELGVEPDVQTTRLYQAILDGALERAVSPSNGAAPPQASGTARPAAESSAPRLATRLADTRRHTFVGRDDTLALLGDALAQAEQAAVNLFTLLGSDEVCAALAADAARRAAAGDDDEEEDEGDRVERTLDRILVEMGAEARKSLAPRLMES
jgi:DNA-binding SARP family transcriptional activator